MRQVPSVFILLASVLTSLAEEPIRLDAEIFRDKCAGAWAGQMLGASYGAPSSLQWLDTPNTGVLPVWQASNIVKGMQQSELFIETVFLQALLEHGPSINTKQAGMAFARSKYEMSGANVFGRENVRLGIMPPRSGSAKHTLHGEEIDFQTQADLLGIVSPGMPGESNRLCNIFGGIMCNGDGLYGGVFVAGMYAAAYTHADVRQVVDAGLACVPAKTRYHECISDVIAWHAESPDDWLAAWAKIQNKWNSGARNSEPARPNLGARLNGAYVVMALLYGNGDMARTLEIAVRCGQNSRANASTAAGVAGCVLGFKALTPDWSPDLSEVQDDAFFASGFTFSSAVSASQTIAERIIRHAGGMVENGIYDIPVQESPSRMDDGSGY